MAEELNIRPQARHDMVDLATHIGEDSLTVAERFLDSCAETFVLLMKWPKAGGVFRTRIHQLAKLRAFRVKGFSSHLIFYLPGNDGIEIIRVLHSSRDLESALKNH